MSDRVWAHGERAILSSPLVQRTPALETFARLVFGARRPLVGALTVVVEDHVLQFGVPSDDDARWLTSVHAAGGPGPRSANGAANGVDHGSPAQEAASFGFDLDDEDLGLEVDRSGRVPLPEIRDDAPGKWVHPVLKVRQLGFFTRALTERNLGMGEAFLEGDIEMLRGSFHHFMGFLMVNRIDRQVELPWRVKASLLWQYARWRLGRSHNLDIADHYDIGDNIMVPMLGATGCYSCGYMERETDDLDRLQLNKMNLIFAKMRLTPGMRVLDTGCGNGGMLVHAALGWGCHGEGFTNSHNMVSLAQRNAERNGVADRVKIHHADFSILASYPAEHFDAIYEVGVWEHLPFRDYPEVMAQCWRILKPNGRMLIHSMASHERVHKRDGYIQKYIFRDSNQIRLHLLLDEARQHDMFVADVENIGRHYYWTLWQWRKNLLAAAARDPSITDLKLRVMLYFLECGMAESRFGNGSLFHALLFKDPRDYRATWRVNGTVPAPALTMKPANENAHLINDEDASGKADAPVYRKPPLRERLAHLVDIVRNVTHQ
jgi:cyclopropane-fatty-acyl-phospholipid synthase